MKRIERLTATFEMVLTSAHLALDAQVQQAAGSPDGMSPRSFFLMTSPEFIEPQVIRHAVKGWSTEAHHSVIAAARDHAATGRSITTAISSWGDALSPNIKVSAFWKSSTLTVEFPVVFNAGEPTYEPTLDAWKPDVAQIVRRWVFGSSRGPFLYGIDLGLLRKWGTRIFIGVGILCLVAVFWQIKKAGG